MEEGVRTAEAAGTGHDDRATLALADDGPRPELPHDTEGPGAETIEDGPRRLATREEDPVEAVGERGDGIGEGSDQSGRRAAVDDGRRVDRHDDEAGVVRARHDLSEV